MRSFAYLIGKEVVMKEYLKKYPYWLAVPAILAVILFFFFSRTSEEELTDPAVYSSESSKVETSESINQEWYVDVKGAVKKNRNVSYFKRYAFNGCY